MNPHAAIPSWKMVSPGDLLVMLIGLKSHRIRSGQIMIFLKCHLLASEVVGIRVLCDGAALNIWRLRLPEGITLDTICRRIVS